MKILITSDWYIPAVNGVVTSVKNLRQELERRGHEVRILTLSQTTRSGERDGVTYLGSVAAGLIYPGARLRTTPIISLPACISAKRPPQFSPAGWPATQTA